MKGTFSSKYLRGLWFQSLGLQGFRALGGVFGSQKLEISGSQHLGAV